MKSYTLNIGDLKVSKNRSVSYRCLGLGSCVGLFLQDRVTGISGGAHIMLPSGKTSLDSNGKFYTVGQAVKELLLQFKSLGSDLQNIRAKLTGGANVINTGFEVGLQNAQEIQDQLIQQRIFIAAQDLGGNEPRTVEFEASTGSLIVRFSQSKELKIY